MIKHKSYLIIVGLCILYLVMLTSVPRKELTEQEKVEQWKPKDFYLIYKMWTDEEYRNVNNSK